IAATATATMPNNGGAVRALARTLNNFGTFNYSGGGINSGASDILHNTTSVLFDVQNDVTFTAPAGTFNNAGTFTKSGGVGTSSSPWVFHHSGTVNVNSGTLSVTAGGTSSGTFQGSGTLSLSGTHGLGASSTI